MQIAWTGVGGGVRTLGHWNHNPALYQLSYTHREVRPSVYQAPASRAILGPSFTAEYRLPAAAQSGSSPAARCTS